MLETMLMYNLPESLQTTETWTTKRGFPSLILPSWFSTDCFNGTDQMLGSDGNPKQIISPASITETSCHACHVPVFPSLVNINTDWEQVDKSLSWLPELLVAAKKGS